MQWHSSRPIPLLLSFTLALLMGAGTLVLGALNRGDSTPSSGSVAPLPESSFASEITVATPTSNTRRGTQSVLPASYAGSASMVAPTIPPVPSEPFIPGTSAITVTFIGVPTASAAGGLITVRAKTQQGAHCMLALRAPGENDPMRTLHFGETSVDSDGQITWTSAIPLDTKPGEWPLEARCESGGVLGDASVNVTIRAGVGGG